MMAVHRGCVPILLGLALGLPMGADGGDPPAHAPSDRMVPRHPIALVLVDKDRRLLVANGRSGGVSIVDVAAASVQSETRIGTRLTDMELLPGRNQGLIADGAQHELVLFGHRPEDGVRVLQRLPVSAYPVDIAVSSNGQQCSVASLWSRVVTVIDVSPGTDAGDRRLTTRHQVPLAFAPHKQLFLPGDEKLLVADAFGGRLAVVDLETGTVESVREIPGHNIRDLVLSPDRRHVHVAQSISDPLGRTDLANITWGIVAASSIQTLAVDSILDPDADILGGSWVARLGDFGNGLADPESAAALADGRLLVAASGVDSFVFVNADSGSEKIIRVGNRPTAVAVDQDSRRAYVANTFSDSVSVIDLAKKEVLGEISLGPQAELTAADRGERLFYDGRLSADSWFSCHSCHTDGHTNGQLTDTLGDDGYGDPKLVLSLLGAAETGPWAWNGSMARLEDQLKKSVITSMHGQELSEEQLHDLAAFIRSLAPPPPVPAAEEIESRRGRILFARLRCNRCHQAPTFESSAVYDVGLSDESGRRRFNPPSLRGVSQRDRLFHDGRAASLEQVFSEFEHQIETPLSKEDRADLVRFLRSL